MTQTKVSVTDLIHKHYNEMTNTQKKIANFVLQNTSSVIHMSISDLTKNSGAKSESAIVRFYKRIGFSGYHNFKVNLTMQLAGNTFYHSIDDLNKDDDISSIRLKILNGCIKTFQDNIVSLSDIELTKAANLINSSKRLIFIGYAISGNIASIANFMFTRLGFSCIYSPDSHFNAVLLTDLHPGDVIFCISNSGESKDVILPLSNSKDIVKIISITSSRESPLGKISDICLETISEEVNCWGDPFIARLVELCIVDLLYVAVGLKRSPEVMNHLANTQQNLSYLKL